jgi:hypothetical protein
LPFILVLEYGHHGFNFPFFSSVPSIATAC